MIEIKVSEFRVRFLELTEPVLVTKNGDIVGEYKPAGSGAAKGPNRDARRLHRTPEGDGRCRIRHR